MTITLTNRYLKRWEILELLPYGDNFLFLDRAMIFSDKYEAEGKYLVPEAKNNLILQSHFKTTPIFPGVLQAEGAAQLAALLVGVKENLVDEFPMLSSLNLKLKTFAKPGDFITFKVYLLEKTGKKFDFHAEIIVRNRTSSCLLGGRVVSKKLFAVLK